jgi:hypothetical protein
MDPVIHHLPLVDFSMFSIENGYVAESGSQQVSELCQRAENLIVSVICLPELISTLSRLVREKRLSKLDYRRLKREAISDL